MNKRIQKQFVVALLSYFTVNAFAVAPGFYMGIMTGPATNNGGTIFVQSLSKTLTPANPRSMQWGTRILMGNKLNQYASIEMGLDYYTGVQYDTKNIATCSSTQVRIRGFDVVGKGDVAFSSFDVYGKAGLALIYQTVSGDINANLGQSCGKSMYTTKFRPTISIGASYGLNQNWVADVSINRIMTGGPIGNADFFAIGFSYHFVNIYCGQFLCDS